MEAMLISIHTKGTLLPPKSFPAKKREGPPRSPTQPICPEAGPSAIPRRAHSGFRCLFRRDTKHLTGESHAVPEAGPFWILICTEAGLWYQHRGTWNVRTRTLPFV